MLIEEAKNQRELIIDVLSAENLPVNDLPETMDNFFSASENGKFVGVAGLEIYGTYGLLRSLTVLPAYRNKGIAVKLIEKIESVAVFKGLKELYLFTETAPGYFTRKAFEKIRRNEVPDEVKQSLQFSHSCPVSAIVMKKKLIWL